MIKECSTFGCGLIFGLGLVVSQMINPAKVLAFLDIFTDWDPSLGFVMGGALLTTTIGYRLAWQLPRPIFDKHFHLPSSRNIDRKLIVGAILFGSGWGLVGLCPGPAITTLTIGGPKALSFLGAMVAGMVIFSMHQPRKT